MKMKRMISLILSVMMALSVLAGCQAEPDVSTNPPESSTPVQTQEPTVQDTAEPTETQPDETAEEIPESDTTPIQTQPTETQPNEKAEEIPEFDTTLESIRVVVDGIVHTFDVQIADGVWYISAEDAETAFGSKFIEEYVGLDSYARSADIRYEQDEVLTAAYFSTYQGYGGADKHPIDMDWEASRWADVTEDSVLTVNSDILTLDLLETAKNAPEVTADNHPIWSGLIFGNTPAGTLADETNKFQQTADWGFNSIRLFVEYQVFFNADVTQANATMLALLDKHVASAIQNNLHLNLCFTTVPGRTVILHSDYTSEGDFDLFINPEKQEMTLRLWQVLAERYRDIPSAYLSFTPVYEAFNHNLSTGLPAPEYTFADIGAFFAQISDVIHGADEKRLIINELDGVGDDLPNTENWMQVLDSMGNRSNILYNFGFGSGHFTFANMTAAEGQHIDNNNHSYSLVDYPTVWPCLSPFVIDKTAGMEDALNAWPIEWDAEGEKNLTLEGLLPAGTTLDIYLYGTLGGSIVIKADGEVIYEEALGDDGYERSEVISQYFQYSTTDKKISVVLEQDADLIEISSVGGAFFWSGMELTLPEEYAVEDWYFTTAYDVYMGIAEEQGLTKRSSSTVRLWPYEEFDRGRHAVIHEDLSYTTDGVYRESNADTLSASANTIAKFFPDAIVIYADVTFAAVKEDSMLRYYEDILSALTENGLNWLSYDWYGIMGQTDIAGAEYTPYDGETGQIHIELLQLLQKYQSIERP